MRLALLCLALLCLPKINAVPARRRLQAPDKCTAALESVCAAKRGGTVSDCLVCVGVHQQVARSGSCSNDDIHAWCSAPPPPLALPTFAVTAGECTTVTDREGASCFRSPNYPQHYVGSACLSSLLPL